ncbi:hypothetical protein KKB55_19125 [Myxococcota bacterium]|nr:hypothetical protein [Myxococcota bacterium]MBU1899860.1 hypothetical protein [Myxococcota bacterium]
MVDYWICSCGKQMPNTLKKCPHCGKDQVREEPVRPSHTASGNRTHEYHVDAFIPDIGTGCNATDNGWDRTRCMQFSEFLNGYAEKGWKLQSSEYREVHGKDGCGNKKSGTWLVCVFERAL